MGILFDDLVAEFSEAHYLLALQLRYGLEPCKTCRDTDELWLIYELTRWKQLRATEDELII